MTHRVSDSLLSIAAALAFILVGVGLTSYAPAQERQPGPLQRRLPEATPKVLESVPPIEAQRQVADVARRVRPQVEAAFTQAAADFGERIQLNSMILYAGLDGTVAANVALEGFENVRAENLAVPRGGGRPAPVVLEGSLTKSLLVFTSRDLSPEAPAGFYLVRLRPRGSQIIAEFLTREGRPVYQAPATVTEAGQENARMAPMCTIGPHGELILFDYHDALKDVVIEARLSPSGRRVLSGATGGDADSSRRLTGAAGEIISAVRQLPRQHQHNVVLTGPGATARWIIRWCYEAGQQVACACKRYQSGNYVEWWCTTSAGHILHWSYFVYD